MDLYPRYSIQELLEIESDARDSLLGNIDPTHLVATLIDVSRAYRQILESRLRG